MRQYKRTYRSVRNGKSFLPYTSYTPENLQKAIRAVQNKTLTLGEAAQKYSIPKSTLSRKYRGLNCTQAKSGHPTLFTEEEEIIFLKYITILAEWGFPLDLTDLRVFAQKYLNKLGKTVYSLKNNMPGTEWARNFIIRHKAVISNRLASNISTDRAKVTEEIIDNFFENWIQTVEGVDPDCVINYDETNLTDDPGSKKYIFKRGVKYPERVINSSKSAISLMFTATANGTLLPIYVVYKAESLWDIWAEGGPNGTRYGNSKSGWFDTTCFEDWFSTIIVLYVRRMGGKKVFIIGDNLSSHFSENVLKKCEELNIAFVCLPPKSTHLLQPLDVAFYAPLKNYWKTILTEWKKLEGRKHKTLVKGSFPQLLLKLTNKLSENGVDKSNIIAGFNKCGLVPIDPLRPKSRLPNTSHVVPIEEATRITTDVITDILKEMRGGVASLSTPRRKKKCQVAPGKSITAQDIALAREASVKKKGDLEKAKKKKKNTPLALTSDVTQNEYDSDKTEVLSDHVDETPALSLPLNSSTNTRDISLPGPSHTKREISGNDIMIKAKKLKMTKTTTKTKKGKGIGKKSKLNTKEAIKETKTAKLKKKIIKLSEDSTSVSDSMSVHSDSDILGDFDIERDIFGFGNNGSNFDDAVLDDFDRNIGLEVTEPSTVEPTTTATLSSNPDDKNNESETTKFTTPEYVTPETVNSIPEELSTASGTIQLMNVESTTQDTLNPIKLTTIEYNIPDTSNSVLDDVNTGPEISKILTIENTTQDTSNSILEDVYTGPEITKLLTVESTEPEISTIMHDDMSLEVRDLSTRVEGVPKTAENRGNFTKNCDFIQEYNMRDHVIVRYYIRKKWVYFIGYIEDIKNNCESFAIRFYKTMKNPLKFTQTKKPDRDVVPSLSIVKKVHLIQNVGNPKHFFFSNDEDSIYFSYCALLVS